MPDEYRAAEVFVDLTTRNKAQVEQDLREQVAAAEGAQRKIEAFTSGAAGRMAANTSDAYRLAVQKIAAATGESAEDIARGLGRRLPKAAPAASVAAAASASAASAVAGGL